MWYRIYVPTSIAGARARARDNASFTGTHQYIMLSIIFFIGGDGCRAIEYIDS